LGLYYPLLIIRNPKCKRNTVVQITIEIQGIVTVVRIPLATLKTATMKAKKAEVAVLGREYFLQLKNITMTKVIATTTLATSKKVPNIAYLLKL
jgi:hypothetical protein